MRTILLLLACLVPAAAHASTRDRARRSLLAGDAEAAVSAFAPLARNTGEAALEAEFAYALALSASPEAALAELDRAFLLSAADPSMLFFASEIFKSFGLDAAGVELQRPAPLWLAGSLPALPTPSWEHALGAPDKELASANLLMAQKRYAGAAARFQRLIGSRPEDRRSWAGLSIALENLGAFKAAASAVSEDLALREKAGIDDRARNITLAHLKELGARPALPETPPRPSDALKGKFLAYFGGSYSHNELESVVNLGGRLGKFLSDRFDAGINAGIIGGHDNSDSNGLTAGVSGRYNTPLPGDFPLNATLGARLELVPAPSDRLSFVVSPGLSRFTATGSIDLFLDIGVTGPLKNTQTLSLGYTTYFGGAP